MKIDEFVNLCLITGVSYEKLDNKQKAFEILVHLFKENFQEVKHD